MPLTLTKARDLTDLREVIDRVGRRMGRVGLFVSAWNRQGQCCANTGRLCGFLQAAPTVEKACRSALRKLAEEAIQTEKPVAGLGENGCSLIAVPVRPRHRVLGALTACFPTREMLESEQFPRWCDRMKLDRQVMLKLSEGACRHGRAETDDFVKILGWLLEDAQSAETAEAELANLSTNLGAAYEELSLLYRISGSIRITHHPDGFLRNVCEELLDVMNISAAVGILHTEGQARPEIVVAGQSTLEPESFERLAQEHIYSRIEKAKGPVVENNFRQVNGGHYGVENFVAAGLTTAQHTPSLLIGVDKLKGEFDSYDMKLIGSIGSQVTIFLENHRLYGDLQDLLMGVLHALTASIDAKDSYTCGHSRRVALISRRLAEAMGFAPEKVERIYLTGLLHDIGKIGVPEATLRKPGKLTESEYKQIKRHPRIGANILGGIRQLDDVIVGILTHHERPDGKGYPRGLSGEDVPIEGEIIGLADCFDAMTSERTYRHAQTLEDTVKEIRTCAGTQFNIELVNRLLAMDLKAFMDELNEQSTDSLNPLDQNQESQPWS